MKQLPIFLALLALGATASRAEEHTTIQHYDQHHIPDGRTVVTGNVAQFYDHNNIPAGKAVQTGNTIQYYDAHNIPTEREQVHH